jgi:hypothetical protein
MLDLAAKLTYDRNYVWNMDHPAENLIVPKNLKRNTTEHLLGLNEPEQGTALYPHKISP